MCISKVELEKKVQELRGLKAMKEELENEVKAVEHQIIEYMTENNLDKEVTDSAVISYRAQTRETLDKKRLEEDLGSLDEYTKITSYNVLRIK